MAIPNPLYKVSSLSKDKIDYKIYQYSFCIIKANMKLILTCYNKFNVINPRMISGLIQSDGSLSVSIVKSKTGLGLVVQTLTINNNKIILFKSS